MRRDAARSRHQFTPLVCLVATLAILAIAVPSFAAPKFSTAVDTMPDDQYQRCVSRSLDQRGASGAWALAGNFSVAKNVRTVRVAIAVAGMGEVATTLDLAIEANTTVATDSITQWENVPDDSRVLTSTSVTPTVTVPNACSSGQVLTVEFPKASEKLVPGRIYWLVLRTPAGTTGVDIWYAAPTSQIDTATSSEYGDHFQNGVLVRGWFSYVPGLFVPNAYRVEVRP